jgi:hypothetical protein
LTGFLPLSSLQVERVPGTLLARHTSPMLFRPQARPWPAAHGAILFKLLSGAVLIAAATGLPACIQSNRASDTGDPGFPFGPSAVGAQPLAYVQDIKPIFDVDCFSCHNSRDARGSYSVGMFADVMRGQRPGDASSSVVVDCSPGGSMYRYFSGDAVTKATKVFRWMVYYNAAETR